MIKMRRKKLTQLRAFSLLEIAAASALIAATLVPALALVRDAMAVSREMHRRSLLASYAVRILEDQSALVATNWINETVTGDFSSDGHSDVHYIVTKSDDPGDGGIVDQLIQVEVIVFDDADEDATLDSNELRETYRTKVAKLNSYENEET